MKFQVKDLYKFLDHIQPPKKTNFKLHLCEFSSHEDVSSSTTQKVLQLTTPNCCLEIIRATNVFAIHKYLGDSSSANQIQKNILNYVPIISKIKLHDKGMLIKFTEYSLGPQGIWAVGFGEYGNLVRVNGILHKS